MSPLTIRKRPAFPSGVKLLTRTVLRAARPLNERTGDAGQLPSLLQRWRVLLPQGVASILADRLGAALLAKAEGEPAGEQLRAAIGRIRVGATTDTAGTIRRHPA